MTINNMYIAVLLSLLLHVFLLSLRWPQTTCHPAGIVQNISVILTSGQEEPAKKAAACAYPAAHLPPRNKAQPENSTPKPPPYQKNKQRLIRKVPPPVIAQKLKSPAKAVVLSRPSFRSSSPAAAKPTVNRRLGLAAVVRKNGTEPGQNRVPALPLYSINPPPPYPDLARRLGFSGIVLLEVLVDTGGSAANISLLHSSGHAILDRAATRAIQHWRFRPGSINGAKRAMQVKVPIRFRLQ